MDNDLRSGEILRIRQSMLRSFVDERVTASYQRSTRNGGASPDLHHFCDMFDLRMRITPKREIDTLQDSPWGGEEKVLFSTFSGAENGTQGHPLSRRGPADGGG